MHVRSYGREPHVNGVHKLAPLVRIRNDQPQLTVVLEVEQQLGTSRRAYDVLERGHLDGASSFLLGQQIDARCRQHDDAVLGDAEATDLLSLRGKHEAFAAFFGLGKHAE